MTQAYEISRDLARRIAIASQALHARRPFGSGKRAVYAAISHLGYVQIDTISVAERAHHHVLWSRVPDYAHKHLDTLQYRDRSIIEYWAHAAAYLPAKDYRYLIPTMEHFRHQRDGWPRADQRVMAQVLDRIRMEGPLMSRDFEAPDRKGEGQWWQWKPAKLALQRLFFAGEIMVSHRQGFQRVYDLPERVLPADIDTSPPTPDAYALYLICNTLRAHGIAQAREMHYLRRGMRKQVQAVLDELTESGKVIPVTIHGAGGNRYYTTTDTMQMKIRIPKRARLLSPFDSFIIQRDRLRDLFDFDYQIECYVPKPKRIYGYYCLPILYGDRIIGRTDVKADRKSSTLRIIGLWIERENIPPEIIPSLAVAFREFAAFNGCDHVEAGAVHPSRYRKALLSQL